jgi:hypothetical protein
MYSYCYVYVLLLLCMIRCFSVYYLCVNVYCTTATGWLPNCGEQIYQYQYQYQIATHSADIIRSTNMKLHTCYVIASIITAAATQETPLLTENVAA